MARRQWFRHYSDASDGTIGSLIDQGDYDLVVFYWVILELLCCMEKKESRGRFSVSWATLGKKMNWSLPKVERKLELLSTHLELILDKTSPKFVSIFVPKWLKLQNPWVDNRHHDQSLVKTQEEEEEEEEEEKREESQKPKIVSLVQQPLFQPKDLSGQSPIGDPSVPIAKASELPKLARLWNDNCGTLPKVKGCSGKRKTHAEARWRECADEHEWGRIIDRVRASAFCNGKNDRGWRADFDFLIQPDARFKILEGKYDSRDQGAHDVQEKNKANAELKRFEDGLKSYGREEVTYEP